MKAHEDNTPLSDMRKLVHDVRNPLNSISVCAELAKLQIQNGQPSSAVIENLDRILSECRQCSRILGDAQKK